LSWREQRERRKRPARHAFDSDPSNGFQARASDAQRAGDERWATSSRTMLPDHIFVRHNNSQAEHERWRQCDDEKSASSLLKNP
jgi:hypothetical protein